MQVGGAGGAQQQWKTCPRCRQRNPKEGPNNHIVCGSTLFGPGWPVWLAEAVSAFLSLQVLELLQWLLLPVRKVPREGQGGQALPVALTLPPALVTRGWERMKGRRLLSVPIVVYSPNSFRSAFRSRRSCPRWCCWRSRSPRAACGLWSPSVSSAVPLLPQRKLERARRATTLRVGPPFGPVGSSILASNPQPMALFAPSCGQQPGSFLRLAAQRCRYRRWRAPTYQDTTS